MAYDGIITSAVIWELSGLLTGSRITKVYQAEKDEILLICNKSGENYKLLISCNPANPRIHLTRTAKENPMVAPPFCMVLRKHIQGGKISMIEQFGFDRVVFFRIDTLNELGDPVIKTLAVEIMGRHSNIILLGPTNVIYDSIKHVDERTSSVREILPARPYVLPPEQNKLSPENTEELTRLFTEKEAFADDDTTALSKYLINNISGFSPLLARGVCNAAGIDPACKLSLLNDSEKGNITAALAGVSSAIQNRNYKPFIITATDESTGIEKYCDFHCIDKGQHGRRLTFSSVNLMLDEYYTRKDTEERLRQKKSSLVKFISTAISRTERKISIYESDIKSAEDFENYKSKGELLTANVYRIKQGDKEATVENYYEDGCPEITIALDENLTPAANAQVYFKRYRKKKSTCENAERNLSEALAELSYLQSVDTLLANCTDSADIAEIREELTAVGYISQNSSKSGKNSKKKSVKSTASKHLVLTVSDDYEVWIGKNNIQNDLITTKLAAPNDIWLHVKNAPGSHVILRTSLKGGEFTKASLEDAARLAAEYSSLKCSSKREVDFTRVKHVKKPGGARPGKVIFTNQKTIVID